MRIMRRLRCPLVYRTMIRFRWSRSGDDGVVWMEAHSTVASLLRTHPWPIMGYNQCWAVNHIFSLLTVPAMWMFLDSSRWRLWILETVNFFVWLCIEILTGYWRAHGGYRATICTGWIIFHHLIIGGSFITHLFSKTLIMVLNVLISPNNWPGIFLKRDRSAQPKCLITITLQSQAFVVSMVKEIIVDANRNCENTSCSPFSSTICTYL